jgi:hypothetical protein
MFKNKLNWTDFKLEIRNTNWSNELFKNKLNIFWREIMETKLVDNQHIWLLFRLQWNDNQFVTIGKLQKLNKEDKNYLFDFVINNMIDKSEYYKEQLIKSMVFSYSIKRGRAKDKITFENNSNLQYQNFQHHKLPITINPLEYGILIDQLDNKYTLQVNKTSVAIITKEGNVNKVKIFREGILIYEYRDIFIDFTSFVRHLDNKQFTFKNNKLILLTIDKSTKFLKALLPNNNLSRKFLTFDIETLIKDNVHVPYCVCWYNGESSKSYFIHKFINRKEIITQAIKDIMVKKYDNYKIYIHNLSGFDGIFLLKILAELGVVKPIIHNEKIISIIFKMNGYVVTFKDSRQLLIASLFKLGLAFGVKILKSIFPHLFVN